MTLPTPHSSLLTAFIALGSNLEDPVAQVTRAICELAALPETAVTGASSLYRSAPVGFHEQPDFINAVVALATRLAPRELLDALLAIERRHGRVRGMPNGPRTLDLDIALYGDLVLDEPGLTLPHPRLHERAFVLVPLLEIAPRQTIPGRGPAAQWVTATDTAGLTRLASVRA